MNNSHIDNLVELRRFVNFSASPLHFPTPLKIPENTEFCELITDGCVLYLHEGQEIECYAGTIFWHFPGEYTIYRYKSGMPYSCVAYNFSMKAAPVRIVPRYSMWDQPEEVESFVKQTWKCFNDEQYDRRLLTQYIYTTLFWKAYQYSKNQIDFRLPLELKKAISFINDFNHLTLSVDKIASEVDISVPHLHFLFKKHLNDTPHHYLVRKRMQAARNLLATSNTPIKQICNICGFISLENFCRKFKLSTGLTPSQYREKHTIPS